MREPVARCDSRYYYEIDRGRAPDVPMDACVQGGRCRLREWTPREARHAYGYSAADSLALVREECNNYLVRWFCGNDPACLGNDRAALARAKRVVVEEYLYVGVLEDLPASLAVMQTLLPSVLGDDAGWRNERVGRENVTRNPRSGRVGPATRALLEDLNGLDAELYAFIAGLHRARRDACL